ncbi:hypothetical protein [Streptomyces sp. NPDC048845]|uniref:hypothetical protein n=1 Tax=Streptomyces sp. NPDC048845 TaxID=3155390 RepID=UPI00344462E5
MTTTHTNPAPTTVLTHPAEQQRQDVTDSWSPPDRHEWQPAGVAWDPVKAPAYLGDRALARLGDTSGAIVRDYYRHRLYWFVPPGTAASWRPVPSVKTYGRGAWIEIPPAGLRKGLGPHWVREPAPEPGPGRVPLLTDPEALHEALTVAHAAANGPRTEERR